MNKASEKLKIWRENPVIFVKDNFGKEIEPDVWQIQALEAFASKDNEKMRIALLACSGPGKSCVLAWIGLNFLCCYGDKDDAPKGVAVSISRDALRDTLWVEFSKWMQKSEFISSQFTFTQTRIFLNERPNDWFISARSFPKSADLETIGKTLSGLHSKYLLYLLDESAAIPKEILKAAEQGLGETMQRDGGFCKIVQAGNPITKEGSLFFAAEDDEWYTINITSDPDDPNRSKRISIDWARSQIKKFGRDDPWILSYIMGRFPESAINTLLSDSEVDDAMKRHYTIADYGHAQKRLSCDVAFQGLDSTVIFPRQGLAAFNYVEMRGADGPTVAARILQAMENWGDVDSIYVDSTGGYGSSVIDSLLMAGHPPVGVNFSSKAIDSEKYYNCRAEMYMNLAKWIKRGGAIPKCERLRKELTTVTYSSKNGRLILESKEQIKKRIGRSPDIADALAISFYHPDQPAKDEFEYLRKGKPNFKSEYDPFENI